MPGPVLVMAFGASLALAVADRLPKFDVVRSCKAVAELDLAVSQTPDACIRDEELARTELEQKWQSFPPAERSRCEAETMIGGNPSYVEILVCIQMTQEADKLKTPLLGASKKNRQTQ